jgi:hypothetical protein
MYSSSSRYAKSATYVVTLPGGAQVTAVKPPLPGSEPSAGFYQRPTGERLDLISARFLVDATQFWRLCDLNGTLAPDALSARPLVAIPRTGRTG